MSKIMDEYKKAIKIENENPAHALSIYKENCMKVKPRTQKSYKWSVFFKIMFIIGFSIGIITNGIDAFRPDRDIMYKILVMTFGPIVAGIGFCIVFGVIYAMFISDKTKSEKYWVSLLAYIGAARLSLKTDKREDAKKYANDIRKFEVGIGTHIANGILSIADGKYRQGEYALRIASTIPPEGKFGHMIFESIYKTGELLPQELRLDRPLSPEEMKSDYERRVDLARRGMVVDTLHVGEYVGGDKVEIKDSVVSRSTIKTDKKEK